MVGILLAFIMSFGGVFHSALAMESNDSGSTIKWGYKGDIGPENWSQISPRFALCSNGQLQSPINIKHKGELVPNRLVINYKPAPIRIIDDGVTSLTIRNTQTIINDGHTVQLNFLPRSKETISFDGIKYRLVQLHFHNPSENEWRGETFPMEIHFVHQDDNGHVAVIGVFIEGGSANSELQKIIMHLPKVHRKQEVIQDEQINPERLLPEQESYVMFKGSLTTPPCTEGINWLVMTEPITASPAQIDALVRSIGEKNARPIQVRNGRFISYAN